MKDVSIVDLIKKIFSYKIFKYAFVGGISTLIHMSIAMLYIYYVNNSVFQSNVSGFLFAYVFSYLVQSKLVFEHKVSVKKATKYFIVQFGALLLAIVFSNLFQSYNSYIRTIIVIILLPLITFIIHKFWTFKAERE